MLKDCVTFFLKMLHKGRFFGKQKNTILLIVLRHSVETLTLRTYLPMGSKKGPVAGLYCLA
ncbi:hypothetical protein KL86DES1_20769 [uncultured Desulfovibrio sp.]|uniref:Uncharacterized protein n=1 Tax=uncultured Desulfovibrio sp. TaxID=167968 RepID=A0A212L518_9BACT|nr:hypothetical protein KL86DES1_20769 [uncultured Desulfovibrio sp.]VZH33670.1 conserved protein of unknown function [Desulfovibrio sp. 86]